MLHRSAVAAAAAGIADCSKCVGEAKKQATHTNTHTNNAHD